ncbi:hypothetical protein Y032_0847g2666 [Ancylostoma ceylanicum]|uniref:Uncharacterized protein n=1 Tax=Ancylostoma ceylanicum TaxID=53326 RepID=A0A016WCY7_9BILA|nr:hypothetical protein Y032_0847g2666 [Ancylostoma ceylanicum]
MKPLVAILCTLICFCAARRLYYCKWPFFPPPNENCTQKRKVWTYDWREPGPDKCYQVECCECTGTYNIWNDNVTCNALCIS